MRQHLHWTMLRLYAMPLFISLDYVSLQVVIIHLLCTLSCDRSIVSSKASCSQSVIQCAIFQVPVSSLFLTVIQQLFRSSSSSSSPFIFPSIMFQKAVPTQDTVNPISLCTFSVGCLVSSLTLRNTSSFLTRRVQLIFSTLSRYF